MTNLITQTFNSIVNVWYFKNKNGIFSKIEKFGTTSIAWTALPEKRRHFRKVKDFIFLWEIWRTKQKYVKKKDTNLEYLESILKKSKTKFYLKFPNSSVKYAPFAQTKIYDACIIGNFRPFLRYLENLDYYHQIYLFISWCFFKEVESLESQLLESLHLEENDGKVNKF